MARKQVSRELSSSANGSADHSGDAWDSARGGAYFDGLKIGSRNQIQLQTGKKGGRYVVSDGPLCGLDGQLEKKIKRRIFALAILNLFLANSRYENPPNFVFKRVKTWK